MKQARTEVFAAVILAAGRSSRMGRPKLLLPWGETSIAGHLIAQWARLKVKQLVFVCAAGDAAMGDELDRLEFPPSNRIYNESPERGMFSSVQCAASWSGWETGLTHWAMILGDQPHLRPATLSRLIEFARQFPDQICQPAFQGRPRHPVIIPRRIFLDLPRSECGTLKQFLSQHPARLCELNDPGLDLDLDRPEDYARAMRLPG